MKLFQKLRERHTDYTADAVALFTRFSQRHSLTYEVTWTFRMR